MLANYRTQFFKGNDPSLLFVGTPTVFESLLKRLSLTMLINYHTEFLTGTIFGWHHLLKDDNFKQ
ncbi:MAG: hypothetical protein ABI237_14520, partial [Ginsengibacter sp.]